MEFIEFPKLGIHINVNPVAFSIGPFSVHWYGIIIASAIMFTLWLAMRDCKKFGYKEDDLIDAFLIALPVSIIFARLFFVIFTWDLFKNDLLGIFRIWEGGLAIFGALIGAVLSVFIYTRRKKMSMMDLLDFICVYLPLAQAIGRWGNFTNQELYGTNTELPWGMTGSIIQAYPYPGVDAAKPVHPTFLYESLLNLMVFFILLRLRKHKKVSGTVFASYLMLYSFVRFLMEFLRTDDFGVGAIRYNQVFAALVFVAALLWLILLYRYSAKKEEESEPVGPSPFSNVLEALESEENPMAQESDADASSGSSEQTEPTGEKSDAAVETAEDTTPAKITENTASAKSPEEGDTGDKQG